MHHVIHYKGGDSYAIFLFRTDADAWAAERNALQLKHGFQACFRVVTRDDDEGRYPPDAEEAPPGPASPEEIEP